MFKSAIAASAALFTSAGAALAGPYVNIETNAGWVGDDYSAATTDLHVGYEGDLGGSATYYVQGGPALVSVDGEGTDTEISGKAGIGVDVSERLNVYGEVSFLSADNFDMDTNYGAKLGAKFSF